MEEDGDRANPVDDALSCPQEAALYRPSVVQRFAHCLKGQIHDAIRHGESSAKPIKLGHSNFHTLLTQCRRASETSMAPVVPDAVTEADHYCKSTFTYTCLVGPRYCGMSREQALEFRAEDRREDG
ncbi:MAG: hypothetical protein LQ348_006008 [Seirophora lacunosa]|nr:MAG: hypothetical protein LQ348_006008 [Seirophora lacunosa]